MITQRKALSIPDLFIIAGTRAALGAGIRLLVADKLDDDRQKDIGWSLLSVEADQHDSDCPAAGLWRRPSRA